MTIQDQLVSSQIAKTQPKQHSSPADWIAQHILPSIQSTLTARRLSIIAFVSFALLIVGLFGASFLKPWYNWDMSAYFAATMKDFNPALTNQEMHEQSWALIKEISPEDDFTNLTQVGEYRQHMIANPDDFVSMLPMYEVKFLYLAMAKWMTPYLGLAESYYLISAVALPAFGFVLLFWMTRGRFLQAAPLVAGALLALNSFKLGLYVTPDLPAAVFTVWGCERIIARRPWLGMALLLIGFGIRPDMLLFLFAFLLSALLFKRDIVPALVGFGVALVSYKFITSGSHHPGWWTHFYFSCVEIQNTLIDFAPDFSVTAYLKGIFRGVAVGLRDHDWWAILTISLAGWALLVRAGKSPDKVGTQMMLACVMAMGGKFITFPMPEDRFYLAIIMVMVMVLLEAWKPDFSSDKAIDRA